VRQVRWTVGPGSPVWTGGPGRTRNRPSPESSAAATPRVNTIRERPACPGALAARLLTTLWTTLAYHCVPAPVQSPALGSSTPATLTATSRRALGPSRDSDRRAPAAAVAHAGPGGGVRPRRHETRSRGALACDAVRLSSRATGKLGFALADVAALPRAALVVGTATRRSSRCSTSAQRSYSTGSPSAGALAGCAPRVLPDPGAGRGVDLPVPGRRLHRGRSPNPPHAHASAMVYDMSCATRPTRPSRRPPRSAPGHAPTTSP
jgi:hypothetical protein